MNLKGDPQSQLVIGVILIVLALASVTGWALQASPLMQAHQSLIDNLNARIKAWWAMIIIFVCTMAIGRLGSLVLFAVISFLALREFITLTPTRPADHRALFWAFFILMPLHYLLLAINWLALYLIFIPVYAYLWIPISNAIAGDTNDFLGRTAKIQWALMVCVYFVSYAPALLYLRTASPTNPGGKLLLFLVLVVQMSDVFQYIVGKLLGRHSISPLVSPNKTIEGFVGGIAAAVGLGACLYWLTPFNPWQAVLMSLTITLMGFVGGLVMSAIKRDRGVKDYSSFIPGHGGILDRIDSLCFAAPVFYHVTRYFFAP